MAQVVAVGSSFLIAAGCQMHAAASLQKNTPVSTTVNCFLVDLEFSHAISESLALILLLVISAFATNCSHFFVLLDGRTICVEELKL